MVRLKDIAEETGLSVTTVSRVLNNTAADVGIAPATQKKVWRVARQLNYQPNKAARNLRMGRRPETVLFLSSVLMANRGENHGLDFLAHPFFSHLMHGIHLGLSEQGRCLAYFCLNRDNLSQLEVLLEEAIIGVISFGYLPGEVFRLLEAKNLPCVSIGAAQPAAVLSRVVANNQMALEQAVDHLVGLGHRRISLLSLREGPGNDYPAFVERSKAFQGAIARYGTEVRARVEIIDRKGRSDTDAACALAGKVLGDDSPPTAIIAVNDMCAVGVLKAAHSLNVRVPGDLSVVGIDNIDWAQHTHPPLTTVHIPKEEMGFQAVSVLDDLLSGKGDVPGQIRVPIRLMIRESTGPCNRLI